MSFCRELFPSTRWRFSLPLSQICCFLCLHNEGSSVPFIPYRQQHRAILPGHRFSLCVEVRMIADRTPGPPSPPPPTPFVNTMFWRNLLIFPINRGSSSVLREMEFGLHARDPWRKCFLGYSLFACGCGRGLLTPSSSLER